MRIRRNFWPFRVSRARNYDRPYEKKVANEFNSSLSQVSLALEVASFLVIIHWSLHFGVVSWFYTGGNKQIQ